MDKKLEELVRSRAQERCEYCLLSQASSKLTFPIDHIIARQHGGKTEQGNLALCCGRCNQHKGPNLAGIDPETGQLTRLFHPRTDSWQHHFIYEDDLLRGLTEIGRTTITVLGINYPYNLAVRRALAAARDLPPRS